MPACAPSRAGGLNRPTKVLQRARGRAKSQSFLAFGKATLRVGVTGDRQRASPREDASRVRSGAAPEALADICNATLILIRRRPGNKPRDAREAFAASKWTAIRLVMRS